MNCKECPYIKDEFNERMSYCEKHFPDYYSEKDIEECCYCNKVDGRLCWTDSCDKFPAEKIRRICIKNPKKRRSTKRERDKKYKRRLEKLYYYCSRKTSSPRNKNRNLPEDMEDVVYYKRFWFTGTKKKYSKTQSNKTVRRNKYLSGRDRGNYKKVYRVCKGD